VERAALSLATPLQVMQRDSDCW